MVPSCPACANPPDPPSLPPPPPPGRRCCGYRLAVACVFSLSLPSLFLVLKNLQKIRASSTTSSSSSSSNTSSFTSIASSLPSSSPPLASQPEGCISPDQGLRELLNATEDVFILTPPKAAGSSFIEFARTCSKNVQAHHMTRECFLVDFIQNVDDGIDGVVDRVWGDRTRGCLGKHRATEIDGTGPRRETSNRTLIVWSHREETSRFASAVRHVVKQMCKNNNDPTSVIEDYVGPGISMNKTDTTCVISENSLARDLISKMPREIGHGIPNVLTCRSYQLIADKMPAMIFADFRQADTIMLEVARRHCPELMPKLPLRTNSASDYRKDLMVKLSEERENTVATNRTVPLDAWMKEKDGYWLELLNKKCQDKTQRLENALESCPHHILRLTEDWVGQSNV